MMKAKTAVILGALIVSFVVLVLLLWLVPGEYLDTATIASIVWLAVLSFVLFGSPKKLVEDGFSGKRTLFASLGISSVFIFAAFFIALLALISALNDGSGLAVGMIIVSFGIFLFGVFIGVGSAAIIEKSESHYPQSAHHQWAQDVQMLQLSISSPELKRSLHSLSEKCKYSPSDAKEISPFREEINALLNKIAGELATNEYSDVDVLNLIKDCNNFLDKRSVVLIRHRSDT